MSQLRALHLYDHWRVHCGGVAGDLELLEDLASEKFTEIIEVAGKA